MPKIKASFFYANIILTLLIKNWITSIDISVQVTCLYETKYHGQYF